MGFHGMQQQAAHAHAPPSDVTRLVHPKIRAFPTKQRTCANRVTEQKRHGEADSIVYSSHRHRGQPVPRVSGIGTSKGRTSRTLELLDALLVHAANQMLSVEIGWHLRCLGLPSNWCYQ